MNLDNDRIQTLTQSAIAILVILGGGLLLVLDPTQSDKVIPVITFVVGYYFSQASVTKGSQLASATIAANPQSPTNPSGGGTGSIP